MKLQGTAFWRKALQQFEKQLTQGIQQGLAQALSQTGTASTPGAQSPFDVSSFAPSNPTAPAAQAPATQAAQAAKAAPAAKKAKKKFRSFKTLNINVKSNPLMSQARVRHDVKKASKQAGLIGWNEISPKRYFSAIRSLGKDWGHYMPKDGGLRIPNPISWKKSEWKAEASGFMKTHGGKAKVSPNRYITWVKLKNKATGEEVVRMNTHLVSGAWSKGPKKAKAWRQKMWKIHMQKLDKLVERFEKKGMKVIVGGDFNRDSYKVLGNDVAYDNKLNVGTHGKSTLDYLMHTKNGLKKVSAGVQRGYASDHDAVIARYRFNVKG